MSQTLRPLVSNAGSFRDALFASNGKWSDHLRLFADHIDQTTQPHEQRPARAETTQHPSGNLRTAFAALLHGRQPHSYHRIKIQSQQLMRIENRKRMHLTAIEIDAERDYHKEMLPYLEYVNSNLLLSEQLEAAIFDWSDIQPLYRAKMNLHQQSISENHQPQALKNLFRIAFPHIEDWPFDNLYRMIKDKRIKSLRETIKTAVAEGDEIDHEFVVQKLSEIVKIERSVAAKTRVISYLATPISFVPVFGSILQKPVEEAAAKITANKARKNIEWYFMVSEQAEKISECATPDPKTSGI